MSTTLVTAPAKVKNILYLTDFSGPSEAALTFATTLGRGYGAKIHALHVLMPAFYVYTTPELTVAAIEAAEQQAQAEMQRVDSRLAGLEHTTLVERGVEVWPAVQRAIADDDVDLIILGTHGRTGAKKLLLGSVAEEIFRLSPVPVLTVGPEVQSSVHDGRRIRSVLFPTDFTPESLAGAPYAVSLARENRAHLLLLLVMHKPNFANDNDKRLFEKSVAERMDRLYKIVPPDAKLYFAPDAAVEYGDPAGRIVESAKQCNADVIVIGVRGAVGRLGPATHLERATAHKIVAHAPCPVLTVRSELARR
jgi:nucleotide-binding universal stress UspA family protein